MAGDWIKWVKGLIRRPEIIRAAGMLARSRHDVAGRWMDLMEWTDENVSEADRVSTSDDALVKNLTPETIDDLVGLPEFARAMSSAGWLAVRSADVVFVNYFRHNADTAKDRALGAKRAAKKRGRDESNAPSVTPSVTREEKRREDTKPKAEAAAPPFPPVLDREDFRKAWDDYLAYRREGKLKRLRPRSVAGLFAEMVVWGPDAAIQAIRTTIAKGWTGVFEPKGEFGRPLKPAPKPGPEKLDTGGQAAFKAWWRALDPGGRTAFAQGKGVAVSTVDENVNWQRVPAAWGDAIDAAKAGRTA